MEEGAGIESAYAGISNIFRMGSSGYNRLPSPLGHACILVRRVGFEPTDRWLSTNEVCHSSRHRRTSNCQRFGGPGGSRTHFGGFADRHLTSRTLDLGARGRIRTATRLALRESGMPGSRHSRTKNKRPAVSSGPRELSKMYLGAMYPHHLQ